MPDAYQIAHELRKINEHLARKDEEARRQRRAEEAHAEALRQEALRREREKEAHRLRELNAPLVQQAREARETYEYNMRMQEEESRAASDAYMAAQRHDAMMRGYTAYEEAEAIKSEQATLSSLRQYYESKAGFFSASATIFDGRDYKTVFKTLERRAARNPSGASAQTLDHFRFVRPGKASRQSGPRLDTHEREEAARKWQEGVDSRHAKRNSRLWSIIRSRNEIDSWDLERYYVSQAGFFNASSEIFSLRRGISKREANACLLRRLDKRAEKNPGGAAEKTLLRFNLKPRPGEDFSSVGSYKRLLSDEELASFRWY